MKHVAVNSATAPANPAAVRRCGPAHLHDLDDQCCVRNAASKDSDAVIRSGCRHNTSGGDHAQGGLDAHTAVQSGWHPACTLQPSSPFEAQTAVKHAAELEEIDIARPFKTELIETANLK